MVWHSGPVSFMGSFAGFVCVLGWLLRQKVSHCPFSFAFFVFFLFSPVFFPRLFSPARHDVATFQNNFCLGIPAAYADEKFIGLVKQKTDCSSLQTSLQTMFYKSNVVKVYGFLPLFTLSCLQERALGHLPAWSEHSVPGGNLANQFTQFGFQSWVIRYQFRPMDGLFVNFAAQ